MERSDLRVFLPWMLATLSYMSVFMQSHTAVITSVLLHAIEPGTGNPPICSFFKIVLLI